MATAPQYIVDLEKDVALALAEYVRQSDLRLGKDSSLKMMMVSALNPLFIFQLQQGHQQMLVKVSVAAEPFDEWRQPQRGDVQTPGDKKG